MIRGCEQPQFAVVQFSVSTPIGIALVDVDVCMPHGAEYDNMDRFRQRSWEGQPMHRAYEHLAQINTEQAALWHALWMIVDGKVTARSPVSH